MKSIRNKLLTVHLVSMVSIYVLLVATVMIFVSRLMINKARIQMEYQCLDSAAFYDNSLSKIADNINLIKAFGEEKLQNYTVDDSDHDSWNEVQSSLYALLNEAAEHIPGSLSYYVEFKSPDVDSDFEICCYRKFDSEVFKTVDKENCKHGQVNAVSTGWKYPHYDSNCDAVVVSYEQNINLKDGNEILVGIDVAFAPYVDYIKKFQQETKGYAFVLDSNDKVVFREGAEIGSERPAIDQFSCVSVEKKLVNNTTLVFVMLKSDVYQNFIFHVIALTVISLVLIFLCSLVVVNMSYKITKPLNDLIDASKKILNGDYDVKIHCNTDDEVKLLADSFTRTIDHLRDYDIFIKNLAYNDPLTGVQNITSYKDRVMKLNKKIMAGEFALSVGVFDVNNLKKINDTYGHQAGNELIKAGCRLIRETFLFSTLYRIGGDEFVVILEGYDYENRQTLFEKFYEKIRSAEFIYNEKIFPFTMAGDYSDYISESDDDFSDIFQRADKKMYERKVKMKKEMEILAETEASLEELPELDS